MSGEPLVIADVTVDPRTAAAPARLLGLGVRSLVNMPCARPRPHGGPADRA